MPTDEQLIEEIQGGSIAAMEMLVRLFGLPVLYPFVAIAVMIATIVLSLSLLYGTMRRKEVM
ncbi:hypothetical protein [Paenibacillus harenae]|uniref:hypothetical protein n=1 Tax=Paenibacillus harenae TaxID=306543 RepID=UPI0027D8BA34|nr:hypothetical protein [Paenibacillus harenae]